MNSFEQRAAVAHAFPRLPFHDRGTRSGGLRAHERNFHPFARLRFRHGGVARGFDRIEEIVNREIEGAQRAIERGQLQPAFVIEEVRDVRLGETDATGKLGPGQLARFDAAREFAAERFRKRGESHRRSI